jgi:hypothetical protein
MRRRDGARDHDAEGPGVLGGAAGRIRAAGLDVVAKAGEA